jgi:hypothetical protein
MQWVCSLRDSLQGLDELYASYPPYEPASHFPPSKLTSLRRGRPNGHREAPLLHLQLFKSSTGYSSMQIANRLALSALLRLPENTNEPPSAQPALAVERAQLLWETASRVRSIRLKSTWDSLEFFRFGSIWCRLEPAPSLSEASSSFTGAK